MARFISRKKGVSGSRPGSLVHIGDQKVDNVVIKVMQYDKSELIEKEVQGISDAVSMINNDTITWINVIGLHDTKLISDLGRHLSVDNLLLEDILNTGHRQKCIIGDGMLVFIVKLLTFDPEERKINSDQLSILAGKNFVVTLHERMGGQLEPVRERIRTTMDRKRIIYPDYLSYAILDCIIDRYMDIATDIGDSVDRLEDEIMHSPGKETAGHIYRHRTELNYLRKVLLPMKELTLDFYRTRSHLVREDTRPFISDLNDHIIITHEVTETYYAMVADQREIYQANLSNRSNEIMQVLTVFAAFFIPLTFLVGIYGMNFKHMPELNWDHGYLYFWILIILVSGGLTLYFKRKKWF